jgi:glycosyltransferase involved in cell wall biosynthesis
VRTAAAFAWLAMVARRYDVVYATGLDLVAVAGARVAGRPVALKVVGDPAWERGVRRGLTTRTFDEFEDDMSGSPALRGMRALRNWSARHTTALLAPSPHLAELAGRWAGRNDVRVVPNGVRPVRTHDAPATPSGHVQLVFVGRLVVHKHLDRIITAVAQSETTHLDVIGDGPEEHAWRALADQLGVSTRVHFKGALSHDQTLTRIADADALVLASGYEGLPHVVLEALACGTPVITTARHGLSEVLTDGVDALLVDDNPYALAAAFDRLATEHALQRRLREGALVTGREWTLERCVDQLESLFGEVAERPPRAVFLGKSNMPRPPTSDDELKYSINSRHVSSYVFCTGRPAGIRRPAGAQAFALPGLRPAPLGSAVFYAAGPILALCTAATRSPAAIVCQSPFEGFGVALLRPLVPLARRPLLQVEAHGDWRISTRLYGTRQRRRLAPFADRVAVWTLRRADRVRVVSASLNDLVREVGYTGPVDRFITYSDYSQFLSVAPVPPPAEPSALFVGVLERPKGIDVLLDAWQLVRKRTPDARLTMIGDGSLLGEVKDRIKDAGLQSAVDLLAPMSRAELRRHLDECTCLVLPSRSEGLPRVVLEAMARERAVVASCVGGVGELVESGRTGLLVPPEEPSKLAEALVELLEDPISALVMGREAGRRARDRDPLAEYELGMARLAEWITGS